MEGGQTEEHIPTIYLMHLEEPYGRMPNRRRYTNSIPDGRTLMEGPLTEEHIPTVRPTEER